MAEPLSKIIDSFAKLIGVLSPRVSVTVFITTATLFLFTGVFPGKIRSLDAFVHDHTAVLAILCIASGVLALTYPTTYFWSRWTVKWALRRQRKRVLHRLQSLPLRERHILQEHLENDVKTVAWSVNRLEIAALATDGILVLIIQVGVIGHFTVAEAIWDYLRLHKDLVDTPGHPKPAPTENEWMI